MGADRPARTAEWIVCLGVTRDVIGGAVSCDRVGSVVSITECRTCHYLIGIGDERGVDNWCSTADGEPSPDGSSSALVGSM